MGFLLIKIWKKRTKKFFYRNLKKVKRTYYFEQKWNKFIFIIIKKKKIQGRLFNIELFILYHNNEWNIREQFFGDFVFEIIWD
jgi:hypothetical protein